MHVVNAKGNIYKLIAMCCLLLHILPKFQSFKILNFKLKLSCKLIFNPQITIWLKTDYKIVACIDLMDDMPIDLQV